MHSADLNAEHVAYRCSGTTILTISSSMSTISDGPGNYDNNLNCGWLLNADGYGSMIITFTSMDTEETYDYVKVAMAFVVMVRIGVACIVIAYIIVLSTM